MRAPSSPRGHHRLLLELRGRRSTEAAFCAEAHVIQHQSESHALGRSSRRVAFLAAAVLFAGSITASAADLCVDPSGAKGCAATISAAVAAANPGDAIRVHAGTYHEGVVIT